jgi:hypothetical protein
MTFADNLLNLSLSLFEACGQLLFQLHQNRNA